MKGRKTMTTAYEVSANVRSIFEELRAEPKIQQGLAFLAADHSNTIAEQIAINEVPAPPFQEQERAQFYKAKLAALGLSNVTEDAEGNVSGVFKGIGTGPKVFVSAHLDTVFTAGTDVKVREKEGKLYAPGIADNARGLAAILSVIRALRESGIQTVGDIVFAPMSARKDWEICGASRRSSGPRRYRRLHCRRWRQEQIITYLATGSRRYEITYRGPGGHSWNAFGLPTPSMPWAGPSPKSAILKRRANPKRHSPLARLPAGLP
jgi:hypothetical protein